MVGAPVLWCTPARWQPPTATPPRPLDNPPLQIARRLSPHTSKYACLHAHIDRSSRKARPPPVLTKLFPAHKPNRHIAKMKPSREYQVRMQIGGAPDCPAIPPRLTTRNIRYPD